MVAGRRVKADLLSVEASTMLAEACHTAGCTVTKTINTKTGNSAAAYGHSVTLCGKKPSVVAS